ncbi:hypothetical protein AB0K48_03770 [Nonomuraea sp. NPDC055795]
MAIAAVLLLALGAAGVIWYLNSRQDTLAQAALAGARQTPGIVCLDVAGDFSTSMNDNIETRDEALALLRPFMTREMRPDDLLTTAKFASTAALTLAPTRAADLAGAAESDAGVEQNDYTFLAPAIKALDRGHRKARAKCARRILVAVTDGEVADKNSDLVPLLQHYDRVYLAVPDEAADYRPAEFSGAELASVVSEGFDGAGALSLLYGKALAAATGQKLTRKTPPPP